MKNEKIIIRKKYSSVRDDKRPISEGRDPERSLVSRRLKEKENKK